MPRPKKKYSHSTPAIAIAPEPTTLAYSFDLKGASRHTGYSVWALRQAIYSGKLPVTNLKPYLIRRVDLEGFVDSRVQKVA